MDTKFSIHHQQFRADVEKWVAALTTKVEDIDSRVKKIEIQQAREDGKRTVVVWIGGIAIAILGAIGNMIFIWITGPNGPLNNLHK